MSSPLRSLLTQLAWWNVVFHVYALVVTWFCIRPGSPTFDLTTRQAFLREHSLLWANAWGLWMLCALLQIAFYAALARHLLQHRDTARLAVSIACAGAAVDLLCDTVWIAIIPQLAADSLSANSVFLAFERLAAAGGLVVANGLYVLAAFIFTLCLRDWPTLVRGTLAAGYGVFIFGMLLTTSGFTGSQWLAEIATGPTILCFCVWVVLVARSVRAHEETS